MHGKKHIVLVGMPGSGKSSVGRSLSKLMGIPFIDTDIYITERERKSVGDIFGEEGEAGFREKERLVLPEIFAKDASVIASGGGMPCFHNNMAVMNEFAITVYLQLTAEQLFEYLINDDKRPLVKGKTDEELKKYLTATLEHRRFYYEKADIVVPAWTGTPLQIAGKLLHSING